MRKIRMRKIRMRKIRMRKIRMRLNGSADLREPFSGKPFRGTPRECIRRPWPIVRLPNYRMWRAADVSISRDEGSNFAANHWGNSQQSDV
jgi:hypothetical protein